MSLLFTRVVRLLSRRCAVWSFWRVSVCVGFPLSVCDRVLVVYVCDLFLYSHGSFFFTGPRAARSRTVPALLGRVCSLFFSGLSLISDGLCVDLENNTTPATPTRSTRSLLLSDACNIHAQTVFFLAQARAPPAPARFQPSWVASARVNPFNRAVSSYATLASAAG